MGHDEFCVCNTCYPPDAKGPAEATTPEARHCVHCQIQLEDANRTIVQMDAENVALRAQLGEAQAERDEAREAAQFYNRKAAEATVLRKHDVAQMQAEIARLKEALIRIDEGDCCYGGSCLAGIATEALKRIPQ